MNKFLCQPVILRVFARRFFSQKSTPLLKGFVQVKIVSLSEKPLLFTLKAARLSGISIGFLASLYRKLNCLQKYQQNLQTRRAYYLSKALVNAYRPQLAYSDLFKLLQPYMFWLIGAVVTAVIAALINIKIPIFLGELVNIISSVIRDERSMAGKIALNSIKPVAVKIFTACLIQAVATFAYISFLAIMGEGVAADMKKLLFQRLLFQDIGFFDEQRTGELNARLTIDVQEFKSCLKVVISQGLRTFIQIGGTILSMYLISSKMAVLTLSFLPVFILCGSVFGAFLRHISFAAQNQNGVVAAVADEAFANIRTVRAFAMETEELNLFNNEITKAKRLNEFLGIGIGVFQGSTNFLLNGIVLAVLFGGGLLISAGELDPGGLMSFLVSAQMIQRSLGQISLVFGQAVKGWSATARIFNVVNLPHSHNIDDGIVLPSSSFTGSVRFENVTFAYPSRPGQNVLEDLTLEVPSGKILGICGPSGQGKSTLVSLLVRFYDPCKGRILLDGTDLSLLNPFWLRRSVFSLISQDPILFATSIKENIRYGRPDASDIEIKEAAILANADRFISDFPDGYDTLVGEHGVTLSGGQKQRIAIARALLKDSPILILDEATSALDYESEHLIQDALQNAIKNRTVILIAHRLSTIRNADCIVVIKDGKVVEKGTHEDLMKQKGTYYELVHIQEMKGSAG